MKHTPTPWKVYTTTDGGKVIGIGEALTGEGVTDPRGGLWGDPDEAKANAAFIVLAVNSHTELKEALADLLGADEKMQVAIGGNPIYVDRFLAKARALLTKIEGES